MLHKYSPRSLRPCRLYFFVIYFTTFFALCRCSKTRCVVFWAITFVVRGTITIPYFTVVYSTVAIQLVTPKTYCRLKLLAPFKNGSLSLDTASHCCCCCQYPQQLFMDSALFYPRTVFTLSSAHFHISSYHS